MDKASFSLDSLPPSDSTCPHCGKYGQLVSHGYIYKQTSSHQRDLVGKRIVCSPHYGRSGCGRTHQWYLTDTVPRRQYRLPVFIAFISALLRGDSVEQAYLRAIGSPPQEPRHAWRWLQSFLKQLPRWRSHLSSTTETSAATQRSPTLKIVVPTLHALLNRLGNLSRFQFQFQHSFC